MSHISTCVPNDDYSKKNNKSWLLFMKNEIVNISSINTFKVYGYNDSKWRIDSEIQHSVSGCRLSFEKL